MNAMRTPPPPLAKYGIPCATPGRSPRRGVQAYNRNRIHDEGVTYGISRLPCTPSAGVKSLLQPFPREANMGMLSTLYGWCETPTANSPLITDKSVTAMDIRHATKNVALAGRCTMPDTPSVLGNSVPVIACLSRWCGIHLNGEEREAIDT
jgi:hypothetical protein